MRTKKFRPLSVIVAVGTLSVAIAGCSGSGSASGQVTLQLAATSDANADAYAALINAFESANPDIKVETTYSPTDSYQANVPRSMGSSNGPDIVAAFAGLGPGVTAYALQDAGLAVDQSGTEWAKALPESQRALLGTDGFVAFRPVGFDTIGLIYNSDVFQAQNAQPPKTWSDLLALCQTFNDAGIAPISQGLASSFVTQFIPYALTASTVYTPTPDFDTQQLAGEATFSSVGGWKVALDKMKQLSDSGCFNKDFEGTTYDSMLQQVATGQAAMTVTVAPSLGPIREANPDTDFEMVPLPAFDDATKNGVPQAVSVGLVVNAKSDNVDAAQKFVDFVNEPENIGSLGLGYNVIPAEGQDAPAGLGAMVSAFQDGRLGSFPNQLWAASSTSDTFFAGVQGIFTGQQSVDGLLKALDDSYQTLTK